MNAFDLLGLQPRPAINNDELKEHFLELSAQLHPDVAGKDGDESFANLNQAHKILSSDHLRLKHLLELCGVNDSGAISTVPPHFGDLFMKAGGLIAASNRLVKTRNEAESVLEQASLQPEILEQIEAVQEFVSELLSMRKQLRSSLDTMNLYWQNTPENVESLKKVYLEFSYLDKWLEQAQEKVFLLSSA